MNEKNLAARFEESREHLRSVAFRMLGRASEADDVVQEAWLRLSRSDASAIDNLGGWLTTVVARMCLDVLRSRKSRREEELDADRDAEPSEDDPERTAVLADSVGAALMLVLDALDPAERLAFVLHDTFAIPFEEIAPIVGRTPTAVRQLASRARKRVQGARGEDDEALAVDPDRRRAIVAAFVAAARGGDFGSLLELLDPNIVLRADTYAFTLASTRGALKPAFAFGSPRETHGADTIATTFSKSARGARVATADGIPVCVWAPGGKVRVVFDLTIVGEKITAIDLLADPALLGALDVVIGA